MSTTGQSLSSLNAKKGIAWIDLVICLIVIAGGMAYYWDAIQWAGYVYVGQEQYGDAAFWWDGSLHFSQGIVSENPNLPHRMGYAIFGGLIVAALGLQYFYVHKILSLLFLLVCCATYFQFRSILNRIAATFAIFLLVFNPLTAEWLAISTSDALGLTLNLAALLALCRGVRQGLKIKWIAIAGLLLALATLTRPLMTLTIIAAVIAILQAGWKQWRLVSLNLAALLACFFIPLLIWMTIMWRLEGNFALTGENQDSSTLYAPSDPKIQVWGGAMYDFVTESAKKDFHTDVPSNNQMNQEFKKLTLENYLHYWPYHLRRTYLHTFEISKFSPAKASQAGGWPQGLRTAIQWAMIALMFFCSVRNGRWVGAFFVLILGVLWCQWTLFHPIAVLVAALLGVLSIYRGNRPAFLFAAYWCTGVLALYLIGGTWGPPLSPNQELNALGYRLGFQFFFASDVLIVGLLAYASLLHVFEIKEPVFCKTYPAWMVGHDPRAAFVFKFIAAVLIVPIVLVMLLGSGVVTKRIIERNLAHPVFYPEITSLSSWLQEKSPHSQPIRVENDPDKFQAAMDKMDGAKILTTAMSSGFIWNLPGQQRSHLLIYQQSLERPVHMSPNEIYAEVSRPLTEKEWKGLQGAWLFRSYPDLPIISNLPYYQCFKTAQAFVPLSADGKSFDREKAILFPVAKYASQLVASKEMVAGKGLLKWDAFTAAKIYLRRFSLQPEENTNSVSFNLNTQKTLGKTILRFGIQLIRDPSKSAGQAPVQFTICKEAFPKTPFWQKILTGTDSKTEWFELDLGKGPPKEAVYQFVCQNMLPSDTLWIYEFNLVADDYLP